MIFLLKPQCFLVDFQLPRLMKPEGMLLAILVCKIWVPLFSGKPIFTVTCGHYLLFWACRSLRVDSSEDPRCQFSSQMRKWMRWAMKWVKTGENRPQNGRHSEISSDDMYHRVILHSYWKWQFIAKCSHEKWRILPAFFVNVNVKRWPDGTLW